MWNLLAEIRDNYESGPIRIGDILIGYRYLPNVPLPRRYSRAMVSEDTPMK